MRVRMQPIFLQRILARAGGWNFGRQTPASKGYRQISGVAGYVDSIGLDAIVGWAIAPQGSPQLALSIDGNLSAPHVEWYERPDVAAIYGAAAARSGFAIRTWETMAGASMEAAEPPKVLVCANGEPLKLSADAIVRLPLLPREPLDLCTETDRVIAELTAWRPFVIEGWARNSAGGRPSLTVEIAGATIDCPVVWLPLRVSDGGEARHAFQIEIPGYAWQGIAETATCAIAIKADGAVISNGLPPLTREQAARWIGSFFNAAATPATDYYGVLALEHIRHGRLQRHLTPEACKEVSAFARARNLDDYVALPADGERDAAEPPDAVLLNRALREFNAGLDEHPASVFELVKQTKKKCGLSNQVAEDFLFAASPLLCARGEFKRVYEIKEAAGLNRLVHAADAWKRTLALAHLVACGRVNEAADLLYRLAKEPWGWPNTECILYALDEVRDARMADDIPQAVAENFVYAFLAFLDSFKGEWFSRLHDLNLIRGMVRAVSERRFASDYLGRDLCDAAVRHYGLNPTFWSELAGQPDAGPAPGDRRLDRARRDFAVIGVAVQHGLPQAAEDMEMLRSALGHFHERGNPEAVMVLREMVAKVLSDAEPARAPGVGEGLVGQLLAIDPNESVRIAAFPSERAARFIAERPDLQAQVFDSLRALSDRPKSPVYHIQVQAAAALANLHRAADDPARLAAARTNVARLAGALNTGRDRFLGCDLFLAACQAALGSALEAQPLLARCLEALRTAIAEAEPGHALPAPLVAALARLRSAAAGDPFLRSMGADLEGRIAARFGARYTAALTVPTSPIIATAAAGWPGDTLVVVYSCRKYLDTRIAAIRASWLNDLKGRGIPYVILVGDGDNTLEGDVLALDVSDRYEDLPKKTLAMLDWVYRNTDAQYVLKIDDDCYLDVARYFDTLSYRKFHYYGRVIRWGPGHSDRTWHNNKSASQRGRLALDKSPTNSSYADGASGYCLSRFALEKALVQSQSLAGQRLMCSSFMEDKLVGDLLASAHVTASDEDYDCYTRRRTFACAQTVGVYENAFFPCGPTPTKVTHLDTDGDHAPIHDNSSDRSLRPHKIWPTCRSVAISPNSNQLEFLTGRGCLARLAAARVVVVGVLRNEMTMLPHFLDHYRRLGVKSFLLADNLSDDGSREYLLTQPDVVVYSADTEYRASHYGVSWQQAMLANHCLGKWVILADADEFLVFDRCAQRSVEDLVTDLEAERAEAAHTFMIDMYPYGGLSDADFAKAGPFQASPWFDRPPWIEWRLGKGMFGTTRNMLSALRHRLIAGASATSFTSQKTALLRYRPWVRLSEGIHCAANLAMSTTPTFFAHFKYHAGFAAKVAVEIRRAQHFNGADEYGRYAALLAEASGNFGKEGVSVRYEGSESFSRTGPEKPNEDAGLDQDPVAQR